MATAQSIYPASIAAALHQVMSKVGYVQKRGENKFHGYKYAGEGNLLETLRPAMVEAGLVLIPSGKTRTQIDEHGITNVEVDYTLVHKDGAVWPDKITAFGAGGDKNKNGVGDKGLYKALTGANKYLLFKLFQIETGDDPEQESEHDKTEDAPAKGGNGNATAPKTATTSAPAPVAIKAKSPPEWAEKFTATASVAPSVDALTAFEKINHGWLTKLPEDLYKRCADAMDKRMAVLSQAPQQQAAE
jgi:hypothetical protein